MTEPQPSPVKRITLTTMLLILVVFAWLPALDRIASQRIDAGMARSLTSFATARALNAVISAAQGTETAIQPAGVGVVLTPGQVLDPINDLVEKFSDLMLLASIAYGAQKILLTIGGYPLLAMLLTTTALIWLFFYWAEGRVTSLVSRLLMLLLIIRFAVPAMTLGSDWAFRQFMTDPYTRSQHYLENTSSDLPAVDADAPSTSSTQPSSKNADKNWFTDWWTDQWELPQINLPESPIGQLKQKMESWVIHIIDIMVVFVLQVLVLPLVIIWLFYNLVKQLLAFDT